MFHSFHIFTVIFIIYSSQLCIECLNLSINRKETDIDLSKSSTPIDCSSLNVSTLRVITFDLFGALMLTPSSMERNIASILPSLSSSEIKTFTNKWLSDYVSYFGKSFPTTLTHQPFAWLIRKSLLEILKSFNLSSTIQENSETFNSLLSSWSNLEPRPGVTEVLSKLSEKYQLGVLSNGDKNTLETAVRVFPPSTFSFIFSSDYPVNCFKTCSSMYAQALDVVDQDRTKVFHVAGSAYDSEGARTFGILSGAIDPSAAQAHSKACFGFNDITQVISFFNV